jgi:hypothetical protein
VEAIAYLNFRISSDAATVATVAAFAATVACNYQCLINVEEPLHCKSDIAAISSGTHYSVAIVVVAAVSTLAACNSQCRGVEAIAYLNFRISAATASASVAVVIGAAFAATAACNCQCLINVEEPLHCKSDIAAISSGASNQSGRISVVTSSTLAGSNGQYLSAEVAVHFKNHGTSIPSIPSIGIIAGPTTTSISTFTALNIQCSRSKAAAHCKTNDAALSALSSVTVVAVTTCAAVAAFDFQFFIDVKGTHRNQRDISSRSSIAANGVYSITTGVTAGLALAAGATSNSRQSIGVESTHSQSDVPALSSGSRISSGFVVALCGIITVPAVAAFDFQFFIDAEDTFHSKIDGASLSAVAGNGVKEGGAARAENAATATLTTLAAVATHQIQCPNVKPAAHLKSRGTTLSSLAAAAAADVDVALAALAACQRQCFHDTESSHHRKISVSSLSAIPSFFTVVSYVAATSRSGLERYILGIVVTALYERGIAAITALAAFITVGILSFISVFSDTA